MDYQYYDNSNQQPEVTPEPQPQKKVFGIIGLICGIVLLVSCYAGLPFAIAAIVMGCLDSSKNVEATGMGRTGRILGIIGIPVSIIGTILYVIFVALGEYSYLYYSLY